MKKALKVALIIAIAVASAITAFFGTKFLLSSIRQTEPAFSIVSHNDDIDVDYDENFKPIYRMTVYVKIENLNVDGSKTVFCEVSREDLTTCTKSKSVFIEGGTDKIISFLFTNTDLKGACPAQYKVWIARFG